jgi:hypothetical protein
MIQHGSGRNWLKFGLGNIPRGHTPHDHLTVEGWSEGCLSLACAVQRRRFPVGENPTRQSLQPEAIGAVMEVTKWLKPSISVSRIGDSASVQAATRVNVEQSLYGAFEVKHIFYTTLHFLHSSFFVRLGIPFLRPDPHTC